LPRTTAGATYDATVGATVGQASTAAPMLARVGKKSYLKKIQKQDFFC